MAQEQAGRETEVRGQAERVVLGGVGDAASPMAVLTVASLSLAALLVVSVCVVVGGIGDQASSMAALMVPRR